MKGGLRWKRLAGWVRITFPRAREERLFRDDDPGSAVEEYIRKGLERVADVDSPQPATGAT